ncbi:GNAT family N-acetyltransferase [Gryllotalpicola ginsengisoli]|uniref:GNAT family N-acetyltransferase n=1 Tax=Gryllotalpicola ginsengisoli TaxID=444608 RepID=UPI0003B6A5C3|nr:GNAT family protein [Gryllotalpicola ginsengisoli]
MAQWTGSDDAYRYGEELLVGDRVRLRATREDDLPVLADWYNRPEWGVLQQVRVQPLPQADVIEQIRTWSGSKDGSGAGFSIELVATQQLIGHTSLWGARMPARAATFAIMLGPQFASQGYGPEAARLMVGYGFRELGLNRIGLSTWAYNSRAVRAYEKAGFVVEGRRRDVVFHDGAFHDEILMGILAEEFFGS